MAKDYVMIDDVLLAEPLPQEVRDQEAVKNLKIDFGKRAETAWRLYDGRGIITPSEVADTARTGKRYDYFNPDYGEENPCPYPVKKDLQGDWSPDNVRPCGYMVKHSIGKTAQAMAIIHCEKKHWAWWWEIESSKTEKITGQPGPPMTTKVKPPRWMEKGGPDPMSGQLDRKIHELRQLAEKEESKPERELEIIRKRIGLTKEKKNEQEKEGANIDDGKRTDEKDNNEEWK